MHNFLQRANDLIGFFLLFILIAVGYCARSLRVIEREIECLHEDFDRVHHAHSRRADEP
jgi:hypothetical protein